jgi:membrane fusion protein (multidrug efflux system)
MMKLFKTLALCCGALMLVLSVSGRQAPPESKKDSHTTYQVSKPLAKDVALLKINAHKAEFWDTPSSLVAHLVALAKAATGQPASVGLNDKEASHTTYEVSKPLVKDLTLNDEYVCQIRAIQHIEIRSLEKGYLQNILVDEGETVHQGQLLFQIKPNVYEADVQKSEAEVNLSKIELQNNQALVDKDIISDTEATMSAAKLAKVEAELSLAKTHLGFTEIRAPFDGLIGRFNDIRLGSLLEENQLLTTLSDTHRLWVYFNVPEAQYLDYMKKKGVSQNVQLELANKEIYPEAGTIETIQSDFNSTSGNIAFRASFSNPHALLRYGETGQILWPKKMKQAVIVPQKSTFEILDKRFIFVVDKTGVVHERVIKVDHEEPNIYIVASGITPDEMFLLERQSKVNKGDKISYKLIDPKSAIENLKLYAE